MAKIIVVLAIGFLIGYKNILTEKGVKYNAKLQTVWLMLLVFFMGISVGQNGEVISNLPVIGLKAAVYAVLAVLGSILVIRLLSGLLSEKEEKK